jgi:rubredoxin
LEAVQTTAPFLRTAMTADASTPDDNIDSAIQHIVTRIATGNLTLFDGVMSPMSLAIQVRLGTTEFDMNSWWIKTPQSWVCPACGRHKPDIARVNTKGQAMCHLVEHHDHMQDLLKQRFQELSAARAVVVADELAERFAKRSAAMIAAYDNTIICGDCNNADAKAKKAANTPKEFSFSPQELLRVVRPVANQSHVIDPDVANAIWAEQHETFVLRMKIADRISEIAANNEHWFQVGILANSPEYVDRCAQSFVLNNNVFGLWSVLAGSKPKAAGRPITRWREIAHRPPNLPPTSGEIQHAGRLQAPRFWEESDDAWQCPACKRSRQQIVRPNKDGGWTMPISTRFLFDPDAPWKRIQTLTCGDCAEVAQSLGKEAEQRFGKPLNRGYSALVGVADIARCILPQSHCRHNVNNEIVEDVIDDIVERLHLE